MAGSLPLPRNSCTTTWRYPATTDGRLMSDVRLHPQGGLCERCEDDCDDVGRGLSICLCNAAPVEDPPRSTITDADGNAVTVEHTDGLRLSSKGCLWIKSSLGERFKKTVSAAVAQPPALGLGSVSPVGTPTTVTITNDAAEAACYALYVDICNAFIDCPTGEPATAAFPSTDVEVTGSQIEASGDAQTLQIPARTINLPAQDLEVTIPKASAAMRITFNSKTCEVFASGGGDYGAYSGRVCIGEVEVAAGQTFTSDLVTDLIGKGNVVAPFTASSGDICVVAERVSCATVEC